MENSIIVIDKNAFNQFKNELIEEMKAVIKNESNKEDSEQIFTRDEAADYLKVSKQTIDNMRKRGDIEPIMVLSNVRYKKSELDRYLNENK